jgi:hypothetical protein
MATGYRAHGCARVRLEKDTWYHLKLRVRTCRRKVKAQGKAWPTGEPEPRPRGWWNASNPIGNREAPPGIYADAPFEV